MAYSAANFELGDIPRFFLSGKFSDFELRLNMFTFRVHKVMICAKSRYFETLCGENFLEGHRNYVELDGDEDPAMIARLLQAMYCGEYGTAFYENMLPVVMQNSLATNAPFAITKTDHEPPEFKIHAWMYALADRYEYPALGELAKAKFVAAVSQPDFCLEDLVTAIDVVYSTTSDSDAGLRKHVVYQAQCNMQALKKLHSFKEVFDKFVGFSWDFATEYSARKKVWCTACLSDSKLPASCNCGFHGLCGNLKCCNEQEWGSLKCNQCKRVGQLIRDAPEEDDEVVITRLLKSTSPLLSPSIPETPRKKRKSI